MTTDRKLEEIVSNLDDMSETIEEIKDQKGGASTQQTSWIRYRGR